MPPNSRRLVEEGAAIISFKLVKGGKFQVCTVKEKGKFQRKHSIAITRQLVCNALSELLLSHASSLQYDVQYRSKVVPHSVVSDGVALPQQNCDSVC